MDAFEVPAPMGWHRVLPAYDKLVTEFESGRPGMMDNDRALVREGGRQTVIRLS